MNLAVIPGLGSVGPTELLILLTIILLLFGAKRIPELAKGLGSGIREFKKGTRGEEVDEEKKDEELTSAADGKDTHDARKQEETTRAERDTDRTAERDAERAEQKQ
jgi:sec-independent protein translocase protein TatA